MKLMKARQSEYIIMVFLFLSLCDMRFMLAILFTTVLKGMMMFRMPCSIR